MGHSGNELELSTSWTPDGELMSAVVVAAESLNIMLWTWDSEGEIGQGS